MKKGKWFIVFGFWSLAVLYFGNLNVLAQEQPPAPSAPKAVSVPAVKEKKLPNGLMVAVVERKNVPLVTVQLLIKNGAQMDGFKKEGLANMTADLLTKGTKTRTATQIAEQMEFLGGSINTGADWNKSVVTINVMSDKLDPAMAIMADVLLNPAFKQDEIDLLKSQTLDGLTYNLKQPGFLANYVASKYTFNEHPVGGTPASLNLISRADIAGFYKENFAPKSAVLIFTGNINNAQANLLAQKYFGKWNNKLKVSNNDALSSTPSRDAPILNRILVIDLPDSGQSAVSYAKELKILPRMREDYYFSSSVLNSILGGGYSSRLNQEIRIKRGLSYGAGSSIARRGWKANFSTRTQTKDSSAAEVAELVIDEIKKLTNSSPTTSELVSRKAVLMGNFGRSLETNEGLATAIADLYNFDLPTSQLNIYMKNVEEVSDSQIRDFAEEKLRGGDIIIVGDYAKFKNDLAKRFPNMKIDVVKADELDLSKENLRK